jgi:hypothetical protein
VNLEDDIRSILFEIGKEIKIHQLVDGNLIIEVDYEKYVNAIMDLINKKG